MRKTVLLLLILAITCTSGRAEDPYSFLPSRDYRMDESVFERPQSLVEITPTRPLQVTDGKGNITFVTSEGKAMVRIDNSGKKTFFIGGKKDHQRNQSGELEKRWVREDSDLLRVENERGETVGYEEYGLGGKMVAEYDREKNLTQSMEHDKYGKNLKLTVDELTQVRTIYDSANNPVKDIDFEGNEIATYDYNKRSGDLVSREDVDGNVTYFNEDGRPSKTYDINDRLTSTYNYKKTERGYKVLDSVKNEESGEVTKYNKDGQELKTVDSSGNIVKEYRWLGTKLIYTKEPDSGEVTWFRDGNPAFTTYKGQTVREWFYEDGALVGTWDRKNNTITPFLYGRQVRERYWGYEHRPDLSEILAFREEHDRLRR